VGRRAQVLLRAAAEHLIRSTNIRALTPVCRRLRRRAAP
jgi:hypothetical protein